MCKYLIQKQTNVWPISRVLGCVFEFPINYVLFYLKFKTRCLRFCWKSVIHALEVEPIASSPGTSSPYTSLRRLGQMWVWYDRQRIQWSIMIERDLLFSKNNIFCELRDFDVEECFSPKFWSTDVSYQYFSRKKGYWFKLSRKVTNL